jgi:hypothetical protein
MGRMVNDSFANKDAAWGGRRQNLLGKGKDLTSPELGKSAQILNCTVVAVSSTCFEALYLRKVCGI